MRVLCFFGVMWFQVINCLSAQAVLWNGGSGMWNNAANWDCACIPGASDSVTILNGMVTIPPGYMVQSKLITIGENGTLINQDTLLIISPDAEGLIILGTLENDETIKVLEAVYDAIELEGTLMNEGLIHIDSINGQGIAMQGDAHLLNYGELDIVASYDNYGILDADNGTIFNDPEGVIRIRNGFPSASAISIAGIFSNEGIVELTRGDVTGLGRLMNSGQFSVHHPLSSLQQGLVIRSVHNLAGGVLSVRNTSTYAFVFNDTIINHGSIEVNNTFTDALNIADTYLINHGSIRIDSSGRFGIITGNNTVLRNEAGASIHVSNTRAAGLRIERVQLYNNGVISMDTVGSNTSSDADHGIDCVIMGYFLNDTLGQIIIDSCYASGFNLGTAFTSVNHGSIHVRRARQNGVALSGNHILENTGSLDIDTLQGVGIILTGSTTTLNNHGLIRIGPKMDLTDFSINNSCFFTNDSCGYIYTVNKMRNSGTFINYGFLKNRSTTAHTFTSGGTTVNEGVIADYTGFIAANANTDNFGIILNAKTTLGCPSSMINDALTLGNNAGFHVAGIFAADPGRTLVAVYDSLNNIAHHEDIFPEPGDWLWVIRHVNTGCQDTMEMKVNVSCPVICVTGDTTYWTGCQGTNDWFAAGNWSDGVPLPESTVVIPYLTNRDYPLLDSSATIHAMRLRRQTYFELLSGVILGMEN